jgi:hypothetical protein
MIARFMQAIFFTVLTLIGFAYWWPIGIVLAIGLLLNLLGTAIEVYMNKADERPKT